LRTFFSIAGSKRMRTQVQTLANNKFLISTRLSN
jgi:hypothetical protein